MLSFQRTIFRKSELKISNSNCKPPEQLLCMRKITWSWKQNTTQKIRSEVWAGEHTSRELKTSNDNDWFPQFSVCIVIMHSMKSSICNTHSNNCNHALTLKYGQTQVPPISYPGFRTLGNHLAIPLEYVVCSMPTSSMLDVVNSDSCLFEKWT